jgi:hypothetical protein
MSNSLYLYIFINKISYIFTKISEIQLKKQNDPINLVAII